MLTCLTEQQAVSRAKGENNHGLSWGKTAVEMALLRSAALSPKGPERVSARKGSGSRGWGRIKKLNVAERGGVR